MPAVKRKRLEMMFIQEKSWKQGKDWKNPKSPAGCRSGTDVSQKKYGAEKPRRRLIPGALPHPWGAPGPPWASRGCPEPRGFRRGSSEQGEITGKSQLRMGQDIQDGLGHGEKLCPELGWVAGCPQPAPEQMRAAPRLGCVWEVALKSSDDFGKLH